MDVDPPAVVSIDEALDSITFLPNRSPTNRDEDFARALGTYRDGGIFVAHYAGNSEWERHRVGDEIVIVLDGATTLIVLTDEGERRFGLGRHDLLVVPQGVWHRFETPEGVKVMSVTPQPTDHRVDHPGAP